jgi:hypothetical protein
VSEAQLYLAIGIPVGINVLGFTLVGIMLNWLKGDVRDLRGDLKLLTSKVVDIDNRVIRIEERMGIKP